MADRHSRGSRIVHGDARHHHRQRVAQLYCRRPGGQRGRGVLGGDDLSRRQCRQSDGEHLPHPAPRPQDLLPDLSGAVHREFGVVRLCLKPRCAAAVPHRAGPRRRRHGAGRAVDIGGCVSAGKARPGLRAVWRGGRGGASGRADTRRLARRQFVMALGLYDQRPGWPDHDGADCAGLARARGRSGAAPAAAAARGEVRRGRLRARRELPRFARAHARPRARGRLVRLDLYRRGRGRLCAGVPADDPVGSERAATRRSTFGWWRPASSAPVFW